MTKFNSGKASVLALVATLSVSGFLILNSFSNVLAKRGGDDDKINICHATGSEKNPYEAKQVDDNGYLDGHPSDFLYEGPTKEDGKPDNKDKQADLWCEENVPGDEGSPTPTPTPTPTATPTATPVATPTPDLDVCDNIDGVQTGLPDGMHFDAAGVNCVNFGQSGPAPRNDEGTGGQVLGASTTGGQVLGASTMAKTGSFEESLYMAIMSVGAIITTLGAKNLKKAFKAAK